MAGYNLKLSDNLYRNDLMKKIFLTLAAVGFVMTAHAKTAEELRIYLNPGHGSYTPNDRPMTLVGHEPYSRTKTDTTNFFESNTNLRKCFGVLEKLRKMGLKFDPTLNQTGERWQIGAARDMDNNIVMSHVKCGPYLDDNGSADQLGSAASPLLTKYNRSLSEIAQEVDANNFDMFLSVHSDAIGSDGTLTNKPLFIYRGYNDCREATGVSVTQQTESRDMARKCWPYLYANPHYVWTKFSMTNMDIDGDIDFYGSSTTARGYRGYLGVLKHGVSGFLAEGYCHTYQPARHRAMNWDADYMEGAAYAHGIADYFELEKESTGDIYGIVRSKTEKFTHTYYNPIKTSDDVWKPLCGVKVTLYQDGNQIAEYLTDNYNNGVFVFKDLDPGHYTVNFESDEYAPLDAPLEIDVAAADIAYPKAFLTPWSEIEEAQKRVEMAYQIELSRDPEQGLYRLTYKSTGAAPRATLILIDSEDPEKECLFPMGPAVKGENTFDFSAASLDPGSYRVAVEIESDPIRKSGIYYDDENGLSCRGGVVVITDPEMDSFGYVTTATGRQGGFDIYSPDGTKVVSDLFKGDPMFTASSQHSPMRGSELRGCAVMADWSDQTSGYYIIDPLNPTEIRQMIQGERDALGAISFGGQVIGGSSSGVSFQGRGADTKLYAFVEDYPSGNQKPENTFLYRYDIGESETITSVPDKVFENINGVLFGNLNVDVVPLEEGFFVTQIRAAGNNTAQYPGFMYYDNDGNALFDGSKLAGLNSSTSGLAVNREGNLVAIGTSEGKLKLYSLDWNDKTPVLESLYDIPVANHDWSHLKFDYAGNLHAFEQAGGYHVYSLKNSAPKVRVPAKMEVMLQKTVTGMTEVEMMSTSQTRYYNLQGIEVDGAHLSSGVYIEVKGKRAIKKVIK